MMSIQPQDSVSRAENPTIHPAMPAAEVRLRSRLHGRVQATRWYEQLVDAYSAQLQVEAAAYSWMSLFALAALFVLARYDVAVAAIGAALILGLHFFLRWRVRRRLRAREALLDRGPHTIDPDLPPHSRRLPEELEDRIAGGERMWTELLRRPGVEPENLFWSLRRSVHHELWKLVGWGLATPEQVEEALDSLDGRELLTEARARFRADLAATTPTEASVEEVPNGSA